MSAGPEVIRQVLEVARSAGFLGPGPIEAHLAHSGGFAELAEEALGAVPTAFADLGSGGGVPGLVLAMRWPEARAVFIDANVRRCAALRDATEQLGITGRARVVEERAELVGGPGPYREQFELVTARSFGPPAVTAEIAAGLVKLGGVLVVSEPPEDDADRWPHAGLEPLGFAPARRLVRSGAHFVSVPKIAPTPEKFPRGVGRPAKRPLW